VVHFEVTRDTNDGQVLYFQGWESEKPAKAVICLVHGLGEHSGRYAHVADVLNQAGYNLIGMDLRGHGKTVGKRGDLPAYDTLGVDLTMLLSETARRYPALPRILYGHSLGGTFVLYYCLRFKTRLPGVVVTAPGLLGALQSQKGKILMVRLLGSILPKMTIESGLDPSTISRDPAVVEKYRHDPLVHNQVTFELAKYSLDAIRYVFDNAKAWDLPLLLMHGKEDKLSFSEGSEKFAAMVPPGTCTLKIWEGLSHELHNEPENDQVFAYLINQLDQFISRAA
jgi:alpha-beta hydrolase superfamily lysophospholipase